MDDAGPGTRLGFWPAMYVARVGLGSGGGWEVIDLPGGESFRITRAASPKPEGYPWNGERAMEAICFWSFTTTVHAADPHIVDGLLEIHRAIRPTARPVRARDLLGQSGQREHLARIARELRDAVRFGYLRVEQLPAKTIALRRDRPPSQRPPKDSKDESTAWVAFRLLDQDGDPVPRRRFVLTGPDKDERQGLLTSAGRERFERMAPGECQLVFSDFDAADFAEPRALSGKSGDATVPVKANAAGTVYVVKGDDTSWSIAGAHGFENFETIWNSPANEALRAQRASPTALAVGDEVVIPEKKPKTLALSTDKETPFTVWLAKRRIRIRLHDADAKPISGVPYRLVASGAVIKEGDSADGWVEASIPIHGWPSVLRLDWGTPDEGGESPFSTEIRTNFAHGTDRERTAARLHNLGYATGSPEEYEEAVRAFQRDYAIDESGLGNDGDLLPKTRDALASIYNEDCDATRRAKDSTSDAEEKPAEVAFDHDGTSSCFA